MSIRADQKQLSREKILQAASYRLRAEGLHGAGIATVMADAGLTHGAFYSHFQNKDELARAALSHALDGNRKNWLGKPKKEGWGQKLKRLARNYLTPAHRKGLKESCALASLSSEAGRADDDFRWVYEQELLKTLSGLCENEFDQADPERAEEALAFMALMVGSISLSRAVHSKALSDQILKAGQNAAEQLTAGQSGNQTQKQASQPASEPV